MKKFFVFLAVLIGIVLAAVILLGIIEPKDVVVSRSVTIKGPQDAVFEQMVLFKNWTNWSPWYKMDPDMKITYFGNEGEPGSGYSWEGSEKTGAGDVKLTAINGREMDFDMHFTEPDNGTAQGVLKAEDSAGFTKATWSFSMHLPFPKNAMGIFMNMDKLLGGDFESGLNNLKQYVESHVQSSTAIDIQEVVYPAHVFEGIREKVNWSDMDRFFTDKSALLKKDLGDKINGPAVQLLIGWDTASKQGDIAAAFPVSDTTAPAIMGARYFNVPESKAYKVVHTGSYAQLPGIHIALQKFIGGRGQKAELIFEEYVAGPADQPDTSKWVTNLYYLLK